MKTSLNHNLKLGLLVIAGLSFFVVSIYFLGKSQNLFDSVIDIRSTFTDVKGLKIGNKVRFSGIDIGTVTDMEIINDSIVMVEMSIKKSVKQFIRKDSKVEIENEGLIGNKVITIYPGSASEPVVEKNDVLSSKLTLTTEDLIDQAKDILLDGKQITTNLAEVSLKLNNGEGDFAKLLNEQSITKELEATSRNLTALTMELRQIAQKANEGDGDLAQLLNENHITSRMDTILTELNRASQTANKIGDNVLAATEQLNTGNGIANTLLYDSTLSKELDIALKKVNAGLDEATQAAATIDNSWILNMFSKDKKSETDSVEVN